MREGFDHAPNEIFTLHATSADARDKYAHVGYEVRNLALWASAIVLMCSFVIRLLERF